MWNLLLVLCLLARKAHFIALYLFAYGVAAPITALCSLYAFGGWTDGDPKLMLGFLIAAYVVEAFLLALANGDFMKIAQFIAVKAHRNTINAATDVVDTATAQKHLDSHNIHW